jgi:hypothetical protein
VSSDVFFAGRGGGTATTADEDASEFDSLTEDDVPTADSDGLALSTAARFHEAAAGTLSREETAWASPARTLNPATRVITTHTTLNLDILDPQHGYEHVAQAYPATVRRHIHTK